MGTLRTPKPVGETWVVYSPIYDDNGAEYISRKQAARRARGSSTKAFIYRRPILEWS